MERSIEFVEFAYGIYLLLCLPVPVADEVGRNLNRMGNVMILQYYAHASHDYMKWGIEARWEGEKVR